MKITQLNLAKALNVDQGNISRYLAGTQRPSWDTAKALAGIISKNIPGVTAAQIMDDAPGILDAYLNGAEYPGKAAA